MSNYTRPTKNYGRGAMKTMIVDCENKCGEKIAIMGGVPGAKFTKRRRFCSTKCAGAFMARVRYNPHNQEMKKAKYTVKQNERWIFNSPFRKKEA